MICSIFITEKCNQNCIFCGLHNNKVPDLLLNDLKKRIDNFSKNKTNATFDLTGGEPTVRKDLLEIMKYIKSKNKNYEITLISNGMRFANQKYTRLLVNFGLEGVLISLHSHKPEISDAITRFKGGFKYTLKGIKNLVEQKVRVQICFVINKLNYKHMLEYFEFVTTKFPTIKGFLISLQFEIQNYNSKNPFCLKLSEMQKYLNASFKYLKSKNKKILTCGIPFCYLNGFEEVFNPSILHNYIKFIKDKKCVNCLYNSLCAGIIKEYVDCYGSSEVIPIKTSKQKLAMKKKLENLGYGYYHINDPNNGLDKSMKSPIKKE